MVRPDTTISVVSPLAVMPPGVDVTVYSVISAPPVKAGGVKLTVALPSPAVAVTSVGAPSATAFTVKFWVTGVAGL